MTATEFCYWLQGCFEVGHADKNIPQNPTFNAEQVRAIKEHLQLVFTLKTGTSKQMRDLQGICASVGSFSQSGIGTVSLC